ncbi:hypothetical protein FJ930_09545 [Mesorhizobium sp. B2-4-15]|nr:hypothetical protein FJ930_09545 [Mesorhizobium sp. B2-4-15]
MFCVQERPPLACRPSPPRGGRFPAAAFWLLVDAIETAVPHELPIFPLEGEMAGRPEGRAP